MAFTNNQNLENQPSGQADWDSGLNGNFTILDRGYHTQLSAAEGIATGDILWVSSGGLAWKYNPNSLDLKQPSAMSYKAVSSGETDYFLLRGVISSIDVISGSIVAGEPVYVSATTPGFPVSSYSAAAYPAGFATKVTEVSFAPGRDDHREQINLTTSLGPLQVGSTHAFTIDIGHRGQINRLDFRSESHDLWTLQFFSGSAAVNSELLFETLSGGVNSLFIRDQAGFWYDNTDTTSPGLIFGRLNVQSSTTGVGSGDFSFDIVAERFR